MFWNQAFIYCVGVVAILSPVLGASFDWTLGNITLYHSESSYCSPSSYLTRAYKGVLSGFVPTYHIYDEDHDTQGYIGYHTGQKNIYVAFRGSTSLQNWIDNINTILTTYPYCTGCEVHKGFYSAEQDVIDVVYKEVLRLKKLYSTYTVVVTGHSLGGALATLTAADLYKKGIYPIKMFSYGSPRVGNDEFSAYASKIWKDHARVTHHQDVVVHLPHSVRFTHIDKEWFQPTDAMNLQSCTGYEDEDCAYQYVGTSIKDHLYYLGVVLGEDGCFQIL